MHWQHGFFMNRSGAQKGEGIEYHLLAAGLALVLIIGGGGSWALDSVIAKKVGSLEPATAITLA
jgi:putative oxidoreductase